MSSCRPASNGTTTTSESIPATPRNVYVESGVSVAFFSSRTPKQGMLPAVTRRVLVVLSVLSLSLAGVIATSGIAEAADPGCKTHKISMNANTIAGKGRQGAVNMSVYWCWDGSKITEIEKPFVWTSSTEVGAIFIRWNVGEPTQTPRNPQHGGFWTQVNTVSGTADVCASDICTGQYPFTLRLLVFGDGVVCAGVKC